MTKARILLMIAAFLTLTVGSFIRFIVTWDAEGEQPIGIIATSPKVAMS